MMSYADFLNRVIEDGISAVKADYVSPADKEKLDGSLEGFEACRGKSYSDLWKLLKEANDKTNEAFRKEAPDYWRVRCRADEIEWVCNVVSAAFVRSGGRQIMPPTARAMMEAIHILADGALLISEESSTR